MPDNSVDSLVTDPPAGISFMGKAWDDDKGGRDEWIKWLASVMVEAKRVMKPGAHGLVWAIPRTSHWTAMALEDAGFEVRDVVTHLFGSGFPKSMAIDKAIDKANGDDRPVIGSMRCKAMAGGEYKKDGKPQIQHAVTSAASAASAAWAGWGTALKPASEHWILIRKPCSEKTVAKNVLRWGTGAINIDASRVETTDTLSIGSCKLLNGLTGGNGASGNNPGAKNAQGRFPANLVLSCSDTCTEDAHDMFECPIAIMDEQVGHLVGSGNRGTRNAGKGSKSASVFGNDGGEPTKIYDRGGNPSRFFYCAKASKADKGTANTHPTVKSTKLMTYLIRMVTPPGGVVLDCFAGSGSTGVAAVKAGFRFIGIEREKEYAEIAEARIASIS